MGPTASGKTDFALNVVRRADIALISVDSAMVYRAMDIGTAKPSRQTREAFPHALIDIRDPEETFSAQQFCSLADAAIENAFAQSKVPLLVGGSMMYFRAFRDGLAELPTAHEGIREELRTLATAEGTPAVHAELRRVDPVSAARIDPRNLKRMERAIEVYRLTGKPISALWLEQAVPPATMRLDCELIEFAMPSVPRTVLHDRIALRLHEMFDAGFLNEVRELRRRPNLRRKSLSMRTVGYREVWTHLDKEPTASDAAALFESVLASTRQLARKQLTWLRQWSALNIVEATSAELMIELLKR